METIVFELQVTDWAHARIECYPSKICINGIPVDAEFLYRTLTLAASQKAHAGATSHE